MTCMKNLRFTAATGCGNTWFGGYRRVAAVEVSAVIDCEDVVHGRRQADLLRKAGYPAIPVAAGEEVTPGAREEARIQGVALVLEDESRLLWDEALSASLAATIPDGER